MAGSEYNLRMKNVKRLNSGGDAAEQWQMLLALLQPIESRLPFPHTEYASLAGFILFKAPSEEMLVQWYNAEISFLLQICRELILHHKKCQS